MRLGKRHLADLRPMRLERRHLANLEHMRLEKRHIANVDRLRLEKRVVGGKGPPIEVCKQLNDNAQWPNWNSNEICLLDRLLQLEPIEEAGRGQLRRRQLVARDAP